MMNRDAAHSNGRSIFITGATGYIGGRLVPRLLEAGYCVRCLGRSRLKMLARPWASLKGVEIVEGDVNNTEELSSHMEGCWAAYYLVHSMMAKGADYARTDRDLALGFSKAAKRAGVKNIIYLGGLGEAGEGLSEHLSSRREVEIALSSAGVPVTVLRAAMIIGAGSASFEILRYLVERLPLMVTPLWVRTESQPIAVSNVLHYLVACLDTSGVAGKTLDIGGPDILSYRSLMRIMAEELGLRKRLIIPVPVLTPRLSSLWIHLVTPLSSRIARPLAEGLKNRVVCRSQEAARLMPQKLLSCREAIGASLSQLASDEVETCWSDAGAIPGDPDWAGGTVFFDRRSIELKAGRQAAFYAVSRIGGGNGWYATDILWRIRGCLDRLVGGPGLRRGRRDKDNIRFGDALDFWRVTGIEENSRLELRAEMKLPGEASLSFEIEESPKGPEHSILIQIARFRPLGLWGLVYWFLVLPFHGMVFRRMLQGIKNSAESWREPAVKNTVNQLPPADPAQLFNCEDER